MQTIIRHAILTTALLGAASAHAFPTVSGVMWPVVLNPCPAGKCPGAGDNRPRKPTGTKPSAGKMAPATASLTFPLSADRRRANLATFLAKSNNDPAVAQIAAKADQIFPQLEAALATRGMKMNNLADIYAAWWISAHDAAHGFTGTRSTGIYGAVRKQAAQALATSPQIAGASSVRKQELADALLVQLILIDVSVEQASHDPRQLQAIGTAVTQGARTMGVDLVSIRLTDTGFRPASQ